MPRFGENLNSNSLPYRVFLQSVASMGWCRSLGGLDASCAFLRGKPRDVQEPLFFGASSTWLPCGRETANSPQGWWANKPNITSSENTISPMWRVPITMKGFCTVVSEHGLCMTTQHLEVWLCDKTRQSFVKTRCQLASMSRATAKQEGGWSVYNKRDPRDAKYDRELAQGSRRDTPRLQRKQSAPLVSDHKRARYTG